MDIRWKIAKAADPADSKLSSIDKNDDDPFVINCKEVLNFFRNRCIEKIIICLKQSLDCIKKRILSSKSRDQKESITPLFSIDINLAIPNVVLTPPLDELQQVYFDLTPMLSG